MQSVTTAVSPRSEDLVRRQWQYAITMTIRLICFVLAVLVPYGPTTWIFIAGAVVLPYVAVILANATGESSRADTPITPTHERPSITNRVKYRLPPRK